MPADALFEAIRAFPDEDTPRLAYADYLDECDQPARAEFIRAQIELSRLPDGDPRRAALAARERRLLLAHGSEWVPGGEGTFHFRRGFVEKVSATLRQFLALADELHERHSVRSVELWRDSKKKAIKALAALVAHPVWSRVRSLAVGAAHRWDPCDMSDTLDLCAAPHLTGLRHLDVGELLNRHKANELARLLRLPALGRLTEFDAGGVQLPDDALFEFFAAPLPDLRRLHFNIYNVQPDTAERFCRTAAARKWDLAVPNGNWGRPLADLRLEDVRAGAVRSLSVTNGEFFERLLELPDWGGLRELRLEAYGGFWRGWGDRVAAHPGLAGLTALLVSDDYVHYPPPVGLLLNPLLGNLTRLTIRYVGGNNPEFATAFVDGLDRAGVLPKVREFSCHADTFEPNTLKKFLASRFVTKLRKLRIENGHMTEELATQFARCDTLTGLNELELISQENGSPELIRAFVAPERFPLLYKLDISLSCDSVPDDVVEAVLAPGWLTDVRGTWYTGDQEVRFLRPGQWNQNSRLRVLESAN